MFLVCSNVKSRPMNRFPDSLIAFQRMFLDEATCAAWLASVCWPEGFE